MIQATVLDELRRGDDERQRVLDELRILDSEPEQTYQDIVELASRICGTPMSLVTLLSRDKQWFKAKVGIDITETPIEDSFCIHALNEPGPMIVRDASQDSRFAGNPFVLEENGVRFYAGVKLTSNAGVPFGTLCVLDRVPRDLTPDQQSALQALARQVMTLLELRAKTRDFVRVSNAHSKALSRIEQLILAIEEREQQRAWAEILRRDSEMRFHSVIESASDGIFLSDGDGRIMLWNHAAESIFGPPESEMLYQHFWRLLPERMRDEFQDRLQRYASTDGVQGLMHAVELIGLRKDGSEFPMEMSLAEWHNDDKKFYTGLLRDITERKRIDQMKDEFVSTVSHELRTPLTSNRGALALIEDGSAGDVSDDAHKLAEIALKSTERLVRLINDILDTEKIASGKAEFALRPVRISDVVLQALTEARSFADQYQVCLTLRDDAGDVMVMADVDRIVQVVTNLVSNAVKASEAGGEVTLSLCAHPRMVRVEIADKGNGIPLEFQRHIFEKFAQAESGDTRRKGGTGLGLSITKSIVEKHEGIIGFESTVNVGTTFYFELPLYSTSQKGQESTL